jgi:phenylacetic acid degradation operon negative regulatory protein
LYFSATGGRPLEYYRYCARLEIVVMYSAMAPTAKSLILDLLSTLKGGTMPVSALIQAAELFGIAENSVRVALARLVTAGQVDRDERGRYRLGAQSAPIDRLVTSWRRIGERLRSWDDDWIAVHTAGLPVRPAERAVRRRERALRFLGFRELAPGLKVRPDNLRGGLETLRAELEGLGLEAGALVFELRGLDPASDARARGLWDVSELCAGYRQSLGDLAASEQHLQVVSEAEGMVESFLLGGRVIRQLVLDPLLPEPIVPVAERDALVVALRRYDRLGRACWNAFLERHGVLGGRTPADTRIADGASRLAAR